VYFTYILYSESLGKYYKGSTSNVEKRLKRHNSGSEKYTSSRSTLETGYDFT